MGTSILSVCVGVMPPVRLQCLWVAAAFTRGCVCACVIEGGLGTLAQIPCTIRLWIWRYQPGIWVVPLHKHSRITWSLCPLSSHEKDNKHYEERDED